MASYSDDKDEIFAPEVWLELFNKRGQHRPQRVKIMEGTLRACENFKYVLPDGKEVIFGDFKSVSREARKTRLYTDEEPPPVGTSSTSGDGGFTTEIEVVNIDCLEEAIRLKNKGLNPAVLNMASPKRPGGGYLTGAGAQEENLFRRTNYVQHLADPEKEFDPKRKWTYRLPEFSCVYSTNVQIFRASETQGYAFLPCPIPMSFIAIPAYPNPPCTGSKDEKQLIPNMVEKVKQKMRIMLSTGLHQGHDSLVLSAWGCGAFRNPPKHIAKLFQSVLSEPAFRNRYRHISFAIIDDHNSKGDGNFKAFFDTFNTVEK